MKFRESLKKMHLACQVILDIVISGYILNIGTVLGRVSFCTESCTRICDKNSRKSYLAYCYDFENLLFYSRTTDRFHWLKF